jgi:hypothetical protein
VSLNQLQVLTGRSYRFIVRRLQDLAPVRQDGRAIFYHAPDALPRILSGGSAKNTPTPDVKDQVLSFECYTGSRRRDDLFDWVETRDALDLGDADFAELLRYGLPCVARGSVKTKKGWSFRLAHVVRWLSLWGCYLQQRGLLEPDDDDVAAVTRRLRAEREFGE